VEVHFANQPLGNNFLFIQGFQADFVTEKLPLKYRERPFNRGAAFVEMGSQQPFLIMIATQNDEGRGLLIALENVERRQKEGANQLGFPKF